MGRHECKNSSNNLKGNMTTPESRDHATRRLEHVFAEEVEEIDFKRNIMKIIEDLKQDVKNCFKKTETTNEKVEEMNKTLKDIQENQEKAIKQ